MRTRSWTRRFVGAVVLSGSTALVAAPAAEATTTTSRLSVVARSFHFTVAGVTSPGPTSVRFVNASSVDDHEFLAINLGSSCSGLTKAGAIAELDKIESAPHPGAVFASDCPDGTFEGAAFAPPLQQDRETFNIAPGRTLYFCSITEPDGTPHYKLGMIGFFNAPGFVSNP